MNLQDIFSKIFDEREYAATREAPFGADNPWYDFFEKDIPQTLKRLVSSVPLEEVEGMRQLYVYSGSIGAGKLSDTFGFTILNTSVSKRKATGVHIAYLVPPGGNAVYLTLIQGTDIIDSPAQLERKSRELSANAKKIIAAMKSYSEEMGCSDLTEGFAYGSIKLGENLSLTSKAYEIATILSKKYLKAAGIPEESLLENDLKQMLSAYKRYYTLKNRGQV